MREIITSRDNQKVKRIAKLLTSKRYRTTEHAFVAEGARLCEELVLSGIAIRELYLTKEAEERYRSETSLLSIQAEECFYITEELAERISDTGTPQGIFAVCAMLDHSPSVVIPQQGGSYVLLEHVQDPGNVGTILRTAQAFGLQGAWLTSSADIYSPKVLRASMGGIFRLPIVLEEDFASATQRLKEKVSVYAAALTPEAHPVSRSLFKKGGAIMIGNEGAGLSEKRIQDCTGAVIIPMAGGAESLNASIAAGILLWEMSQGKSVDKE